MNSTDWGGLSLLGLSAVLQILALITLCSILIDKKGSKDE